MAIDMPDGAELAVEAVARVIERPVIWGVVSPDSGENLGNGKLAVVDRSPRSGDTAH